MSDERHTPTTAGPTPEPTPTVTVVASSPAHPVGTAAASESSSTELPFGLPSDRPEILVGAAFAGGLVAAFILKRLGSD
jgi:hypothetical protein